MTIVELLVVMGIIAVLSGILVPGIVQVKENAHRTVCLCNMRELGLGFAQYSMDNDEREPVASNWASGIYSYVESPQMYVCPSYSGKKKIDYAMNSLLDGFALTDIAAPSSVVVLFESTARAGCDPDPTVPGGDDPHGDNVGNDQTFTDAVGDGPSEPDSLYRHTPLTGGDRPPGSPRLNYLLADGRVKFMAHNEVEDDTMGDTGLSSSPVAVGVYKRDATVTFNPLALP